MPGCGCGGSKPKATTASAARQAPRRTTPTRRGSQVGPAAPDYFWNGPPKRKTPPEGK